MPDLDLKNRNGHWYATGTIAGRRIRKSLGTGDRQAAADILAQYEARLRREALYGPQHERTFEEAAASYMTQGGERTFLAPLIRHFRGVRLASIMPGTVREAAIAIFPDAAPATRNRQAITPASAVINHAHQMGWCGAIRVKPFAVPKSTRHKPADEAWLRAFTRQCMADGLRGLAAAVVFMHDTGARRSEAARLMPAHVDPEGREALLERTKTDEMVTVALTRRAAAAIRWLRMRGDLDPARPVFGYTDPRSINRRMKAVSARAGIEHLPTHSAGRHSFGTRMIAAGVDVKTAMEAGRWKSAGLFLETYVHVRDSGRKVAAALDAKRRPDGTNLAQQDAGNSRSARQGSNKRGISGG